MKNEMMRMQVRAWLLAGICLGVAATNGLAADKVGVFQQKDRVAIIGDSITEQRVYSAYIETYLLACTPQLDVDVAQFGWSGETAGMFLNRMENDTLSWKPDVATMCYGMNDGHYQPYSEATGEQYKKDISAIAAKMKKAGVTLVLGGPGAVDTTSFLPRNNGVTWEIYNQTLLRLSEIAKEIAEKDSLAFADVHTALMTAMEKSKAAYGKDYLICGVMGDGIHPQHNGQLVMAYAFLKAAKVDGQVGQIVMDFKGPASASEGHTILSSSTGRLEISSRRYPFCFYGANLKDPDSTRGVLPFVPFNEDLNRFTLVVKNVPADKATVKWDQYEKTFTKEQLASGINLAAEFLDNPFSGPFEQVLNSVFAQEWYETIMVKNFITMMPFIHSEFANDSDAVAAVKTLRERLWKRHDMLLAQAKAKVKPIKHTITVIPVK